ncbi:DEAD/DEAH box helicase [Qipengyuania sediminis]|uniref:DEAD/DEAH box helicase n=1 Tax=Qipengyuania sediminis TaxID=1532023 RepID=UPI001059C7D6|nr:DEAD/DEAH box helicase [Qipengyuania sediminis]
MAAQSGFEATPDGGYERVALVISTPSRMPFAKPAVTTVPFDDWAMTAADVARGAVARVLQAWADNEQAEDGKPLVSAESRAALLHPALVASLAEPDASALGLPPVARLSLNLQSIGVAHQPDFRVETRWTRPNGLPASVRVEGARVRYEGKDWRIAEPIWSTLGAAARLNATTDDADRQAALAALRRAISDDDRRYVRADGFIERLRLSYAAGFSLALKPDAQGFDFDPVLFSPERLLEAEDGVLIDEAADGLLPPAQQASFAKRFRRSDGNRRAFLLEDGSILFLDPALQRALAVVREAQAGGAEARRDFARNPQRRIPEALAEEDSDAPRSLFVETQQFSERVSGIDIWRKPVLPWVKPKPNSWLPEAFGLRIGDPPDATMLAIPPDRIDEALDAVEQAVREDRATFTFDAQEVPATEQTRTALSDLKDLVDAANSVPDGDAATSDSSPDGRRYFLQVRDNLEDVAYAPLVAAAPEVAAAKPVFPDSVRTRPKPHQIDGFAWLVDCWRSGIPGAMLADDMGLGKTFQALAFLAWLRGRLDTPKPVLIVAPTGLLANWRAEIERHLAPEALGTIISAYGDTLRRMRSGAARDIESGSSGIDVDGWGKAGVVLTTFETMRDYHLSFARVPFAVILYDEVQKLKNPASQMTRAAKTLNARFQLAMTGTPVENRLQDLWSVFDVIHPGLLGSSKAFEDSYPATEPDRLRALHDILTEPQDARPALLLRRMKDDCLDGLPAKHITALPLAMPPTQAAAYDAVIQRAMIAKGTGKPGHMLEMLHMLRGVSLHPVAPEAAGDSYLAESARLRATLEVLDRVHAAGEKALVFCESLAMQALLAVEFRRRYRLDHDVARIHGGVAGEARQAAVDTFQQRVNGFDVMILSPKAGGVGITLTAANHVIHLSRWWNPAVEDQATDRAFRIGQTRDVHVYLPQSVHPDPAIGPLSFDLKLDALMRRKRDLSRGLLLPGEDDGDAASLFDEVLGGGAEPEETANQTAGTPDLPQVGSTGDDSPRQTLSLRPPLPTEAPLPAWPSRMVFQPKVRRNLDIFEKPVAGQSLTSLAIRDPYGGADERNRQCLVDFMTLVVGAVRQLSEITVVSFDADSVDRYTSESSIQQYDDLQSRWKRASPGGPPLRHIQLSRRQSRSFHDRSIKAQTNTGREIIWDVSNGIDGVMRPDKECTVHVTVT